MQRIIITVVVLAAVGIVSALAAAQLVPSQAGAAPPCGNPNPPTPCTPTPTASASPVPQTREDQITVWSQGDSGRPSVGNSPQGYVFLDVNRALMVALDPQDYPASATFRLETVWVGSSGSAPSTRCFRLFDKTGNAPVSGSEVCHIASSTPSIDETVRLRSAAFALPAGEHEYEVQGKSTAEFPFNGEVANVNSARIIAEWTERR